MQFKKIFEKSGFRKPVKYYLFVKEVEISRLKTGKSGTFLVSPPKNARPAGCWKCRCLHGCNNTDQKNDAAERCPVKINSLLLRRYNTSLYLSPGANLLFASCLLKKNSKYTFEFSHLWPYIYHNFQVSQFAYARSPL